jgi:hypothetical protein
MYKSLEYGNGDGSYQITDLNTALHRMEAIQCFNVLLPGPKLLWQFEELGYDYSINTCSDGVTISDDCRTSAKPVRWDYRDVPERYRIHQVISGLCDLKINHPDPFQTANYNWDVNGYGKRLHLNGENMNAVVVANFRVTELSMIPGFQHTGTWWDYFTGEAIQVDDVSAFMSFAPGEYHVFVDQELDFPSSVQPISSNESAAHTLYPNPANTEVYWEFQESLSHTQLRIYDVTGKEVGPASSWKPLSNGHGISLDVSNIPSGTYFIQLIDKQWIKTAQMHVVH